MDKATVYALEIRRETKLIEIDRKDLVTASEAHELTGLALSTITRAMESGDLPCFQYMLDPTGQKRITQYTSRQALAALPQARRGSPKDANGQAIRNKGY